MTKKPTKHKPKMYFLTRFKETLIIKVEQTITSSESVPQFSRGEPNEHGGRGGTVWGHGDLAPVLMTDFIRWKIKSH